VISVFRREVEDNCALLGHNAASSGNSLPTFRNNLSVQSSWVKNPEESTSRKGTPLSIKLRRLCNRIRLLLVYILRRTLLMELSEIKIKLKLFSYLFYTSRCRLIRILLQQCFYWHCCVYFHAGIGAL
jgi:hypothetical protein